MGENAFVSFGEIMLRLSPPGHQRLRQASTLDMNFGGGEANVAVSLSQFGIPARFVTALPDNHIGQACLENLNARGVDTSSIVRTGNRLGIYYLEHGAGQRPSHVTYDRMGSSVSEADPTSYNWESILRGATWFHFTGITPALSPLAAQAVSEAVGAAKYLGITVSCDLNYRSKLWTREQASLTMSALMSHVDVLFANEEDAYSVFGIKAHGFDVHSGKMEPERFSDVAKQLTERFEFRTVGVTLRESISASLNGWSGLLYKDDKSFFSRHYDIDIVDRVGAGDSFAAGVIYGLMTQMSPQDTVEFAAAASCLKHSVPGDFNIASIAEVETLLKSGGSGRVER